jgi:GDP-L-fucose synthase
MTTKVFVAGHRGLVGRNLCEFAPDKYEIITTELDLRDKEKVRAFLSQNAPDVVILAAARVGGIAANSKYQSDFLIQNLEIQNSVIGAARELQIQKLLFLGSSCIYPRLAPQPIPESSILTGPLEPTNEGYAIAKIAGVRLVHAIHQELGLDYFSLMPTNLYGPYDNFDKESSHVPPAIMRKFHDAKISGANEVVLWGTGSPRREFMHVKDLVLACWYLLDQEIGGELINIGTGEDLEIKEFATIMAKIVGYEGEVIYDSSRPDGTPRKLLDVTKIHSLGWHHTIELEDGLTQTYEWFKEALEKGEVRGY